MKNSFTICACFAVVGLMPFSVEAEMITSNVLPGIICLSDGGGSSLMAVRDPTSGNMKILNQPTDGHERVVADVRGSHLDK